MDKCMYRHILNTGLLEYKYKNSKLINMTEYESVKGSVFTFTSKERMTVAQGIVMTSFEAISDQENSLTHWTPNVYCYGTYTNKTYRYIKGHTESNLKQINTFYLDFDSNDITKEDILLICLDELGFMPTMILKTERGYQVYFVLSVPVYVTKETDFKVIEVAKIISKNLRYFFLKHNMPIDMMCNHFGIARFPTRNNVIHLAATAKYSFDKWLNWSMQQENQLVKKPSVQFSIYQKIKQVDEKWFELLLKQTDFKGKKGLVGRNNVVFTLALACFSSNTSQDECEKLLESFNKRLKIPLVSKELQKIINSAYSGSYLAASKEYILLLCQLWVDKHLTHQDLFTYQKWYKFKKKRVDRVRSHYYEWEKDVLDYLEQTINVFNETTKQAIQEAINIPKRTLDVVLKRLVTQRKILLSAKKGRKGGVKVALLKRVYTYVMTLSHDKRSLFMNYIADFIEIPIPKVITQLKEIQFVDKQGDLFELDIGLYG